MAPSGPIAGTLGCSEFDAAAAADAPPIGSGGGAGHGATPRGASGANGVRQTLDAGLRRPIGPDRGATTASEIALSILAGLVAVRRGGRGGWKQTQQR